MGNTHGCEFSMELLPKTQEVSALQHSLKTKSFSKPEIERNFLNLLIKHIYQKPAANIILNGEILLIGGFSLTSGTRQLLPLTSTITIFIQ